MSDASFLRETRAFFAARAAGWEKRFPDDSPVFQRAVDELEVPVGATALDAGCGSGRALPMLRAAAGPTGRVIGVDVTPEMLAEARSLDRHRVGHLILADVEQLPFGDASFDVIFAAGLVPHLADAAAGLAELARVTRPGGRFAMFHPISRAALAARHGGVPSDDEAIAPKHLAQLLPGAGWRLDQLDDGESRYLALATRL